jgi:hypothetical protein|tara:strand:+ start:388 stop:963 length:576 start_codon:yes stop_codon:yes gene_type:complete
MWYIILILVILFICTNLKNSFERFSQKYNVYLISNKPNLKSDYIQKVNSIKPSNNDKIVRFNHSQNGNIFNDKTDILFLRNNSHSYWGYKKPIWYKLKNKEIILLGSNRNTEKCKREGNNNGNSVKVVDYGKIMGKTESSGSLGIKYFLEDKNVDKIYLIGFTFYDGIVNHHNFKKERKILDKYPEKIIQI